ncbi:FAAL070Cp [Eremothecium gossypii FDAG1]|nr:FAAL070Cp [Eremothecium gossypii FDAG1]
MMEEFGQLSLGDGCDTYGHRRDKTLQDVDLSAISRLRISEPGVSQCARERSTISEEYRCKLQPYFSTTPSPLRQTIVAESDDEMDIDPAESVEAERTDAEQLEDVLQDEEPEEDARASSSGHRGSVIKALLSPTTLGVAAATKELEDLAAPAAPPPVPAAAAAAPLRSAPALGEQELQELRHNFNTRPLQVQVNHHHYYPGFAPYGAQSARDPYDLPQPWSERSRPASKHTYAFTSYLQLALNVLTAFAISSLALSFLRALKTDLQSTWRHNKLELDYESQACRQSYDANLCDPATRVPALYEQCAQWEKCMSRDNNIFFRARSTLSARLVGDVINSFIEPLGWKALLSILIGLLIWCFSSNFLLGFARAKSYYGSPLALAAPPAASPRQITASQGSPERDLAISTALASAPRVRER